MNRLAVTAGLAAALFLAAAGTQAATPPGALYGAPGTPDISGVWFLIAKRGVTWAPTPVFKGKYKADYDKRVAAAKAGKPLADLGARCMPSGMPSALMLGGYPSEIIQTPGRVTVIKENLSQTLRIWTDGRQQEAEPDPTFLGHHVGHWEGETLVVDELGLRDESLIDVERTMPHSEKLHITLRFHKLDPNTLELRFLAEDSDAFEGKSEAVSIFEKRDNWEVMEHECEAPGFAIQSDGTFSSSPVVEEQKAASKKKK